MVDDEHIKPVSDGLTLKRKAVIELMDDPSNIFPMNLSRKPPTEMTGFSHKAMHSPCQTNHVGDENLTTTQRFQSLVWATLYIW